MDQVDKLSNIYKSRGYLIEKDFKQGSIVKSDGDNTTDANKIGIHFKTPIILTHKIVLELTKKVMK